MVTMTTVGYGDFFPSGVAGYIVTVCVMIIGFMVTALPVAIIGGNFAMVHEYNQTRENKREVKRPPTAKNSSHKVAFSATSIHPSEGM